MIAPRLTVTVALPWLTWRAVAPVFTAVLANVCVSTSAPDPFTWRVPPERVRAEALLTGAAPAALKFSARMPALTVVPPV